MRRRHDFPQMTAAQNARICGGNPIERSSVARAQSSGSVSSADFNLVARCRIRDQIVVETQEYYAHPSRKPLE